MTIKAYGAHDADRALESIDITRRVPGESWRMTWVPKEFKA
jgi:hypothetical protein